MLRTLTTWALITGILLLISSCLPYKEVQIVRFSGIEVKQLSAEGVALESKLQISNPNRYKIKVVKTDLMVSVNNRDMGKAAVNGRLVIPGNSNDVHPVDVRLEGVEAKTALPLLLSSVLGGGLNIKVEGTITARARLLRKKIDVEFSDKISR